MRQVFSYATDIFRMEKKSFAVDLFPKAFATRDADRAADFVARITRDLSSGPLNLPCFPDIVPRIRKALDDPNSSVDDIVKIAGSEPRLAARLIQTASTVVFNPSGKPSPNLRAAVTRLGRDLVQSVATAFVIQQMRADPMLQGVAQTLTHLWEKSIVVALMCRTLARQLDVPTEKVFLTGLVHGIGNFYTIVRSAETHSPIAYSELPQELVDDSHPNMGALVLKKWGFEPVICDAVANQTDYLRETKRAADITDVLIAGIILSEAMLYLEGDLSRTQYITAFSRIGLTNEHLQAVVEHTKQALGALLDALAR